MSGKCILSYKMLYLHARSSSYSFIMAYISRAGPGQALELLRGAFASMQKGKQFLTGTAYFQKLEVGKPVLMAVHCVAATSAAGTASESINQYSHF